MGWRSSDNMGTFINTVQLANAYFMVQRPNMSVQMPFALYLFSNGDAARRALLKLPFIHEAEDAPTLVCDRIMEFGCYFVASRGTDEVWEAVVAGSALTRELFAAATEAFASEGGIQKSVCVPAEDDAEPVSAASGSVIFRESFRRDKFTYEVYDGPGRKAAEEFLSAHPVDRPLYYILVYTPEGDFGRDKDGIYQM